MNKINKLCLLLLVLLVLSAAFLGGCTGEWQRMVQSRSAQKGGSAQNDSLEQERGSGQNSSLEQENGSGQNSSLEQENGSGQNSSLEQERGSGQNSSLEQESSSEQIVFEGHDMEGNVVSSDIFSASKLTMINVWATYCNPCLSEMPGLGELAHAYDAGDFQLIGIISDVQEGADQKMVNLAADLIERTGADYTHLLLNESLYYALLTDVTAVPTTFFIDENGVILDTVIGSMDKAKWEEKINALLEK